MSNKAEMIGKKFGRLTPIEALGIKRVHTLYRCVCDCGNEVEVLGNSIRSGNTKSCGCIRRPNLVGFENDQCIVVAKVRNQFWEVECKHCGETHNQNQREIRSNARSKSCSKYKVWNWSGLERDDMLMRAKYGITQADFDDLIEFQKGKCAICFTPLEDMSRRPNIDHDHDTNKVRGILCTGCNTGLGHLGDNIKGLKRALYYLENTPFDELNTQTQDRR